MNIKTIILCGGLGTRLSEETILKPKPMVEIGGKPILWHIMKFYSSFGINDFIICCGHKGYLLKEYFVNYYFMLKSKKEQKISRRGMLPLLGSGLLIPFLGFGKTEDAIDTTTAEDEEYKFLLKPDGTTVKVKASAISKYKINTYQRAIQFYMSLLRLIFSIFPQHLHK